MSSFGSKMERFVYPCRHPSGYFFAKKNIDKAITGHSVVLENNSFIVDFIMTYCMSIGDMMIYDYPMLYTEPRCYKNELKSYSYKKSNNNLFFFPQERIRYFKMFIKNLQTLDFSLDRKKKITSCLLKNVCEQITWEYKTIMNDDVICNHYYLEKCEVTSKDILGYLLNFLSSFMSMDVILTDEEKVKECRKILFNIMGDL